MKLTVLTVSLAVAALVCLAPVPAAALGARGAMLLCDQHPPCDYQVMEDGSVQIHPDGNGGPRMIECPQQGECFCVTCRGGSRGAVLSQRFLAPQPPGGRSHAPP